jgi:hypothetical protein
MKEFQAELISKERTIHLNGLPDDVFPLFEPINEKLWAKGWDPLVIFLPDGIVKEKMIFKTKGKFPDEQDYLWTMTRHDHKERTIQYLVSAGERTWFIDVSCEPSAGETCATIRYSYVGMTKEGHERNRIALEDMFKDDLSDWENEINAYLGKIHELQ